MEKEKRFYEALRDIFVGAKVEGKSGYINLMKIKSRYYEEGVFPRLQKDIEKALTPFPDFKEELFDKLYTFFHRYFSESGSIYFRYTPLHQNVYEKVYTDDKDVILFWKTHMLYYVKTDRLFKNLNVEMDNTKFYFDVSNLEHKSANEKRNIIYEFKERSEDTIIFNVYYSERGKKTKLVDILKALKDNGVRITEETLEKTFRVFEKQTEVDYFINKNAKTFLKAQFNIWLYQYIFTGESNWTEERIKQLQVLKDIAFKVINFIAQFEDELAKIWNKPKLVLNSNYVITLDRIAGKSIGLMRKILSHKNFDTQAKEWKKLGIIDDSFNKGKIVMESGNLDKKYQYLPIDTKYFKDLELEILGLFDDIDKALDGWLIHSENYQALNTILPKFKEKVQTIYIDPPFNTGDDFAYIDKFQDSSWLTLMENRLQLARNLLNEKGNFFLHLDYNSDFVGRFLLNYIFKEENFGREIIFKRTPGHHLSSGLDVMTDTILWYTKTDNFIYNQQYQKLSTEEIEEKFPYIEKETGRRFTHEKLEQSSNVYSKGETRIIQGRKVVSQIGWRWSQETFDKRLSKNPYCIFWTQNGRPRYKRYADEYKGREISNLWDDITLISSNSAEYIQFETQKPESLLRRVINQSSQQRGIVLDFFLGSGTTTAVAHKLRRKWIGVEMGDYFKNILLARMKEVLADKGNHEPCGISKEVDWQGGGFFKYYNLEQYEDTLRKTKYKDSDLFDNPYEDPYNQYIFMKDKKMLDALEIDYKNNKVKVDLSKLYKNIDIPETLSNLRGKWIKQIGKDFVEFEDGERIDTKNLDYKVIKPLIWWEK